MELAAESTLKRPYTVIQPRKGLFQLDLASVWHYREMLYFLVWRDVIVRYKQTVIGAAWVILQPMITMIIFTLIFGTWPKSPLMGYRIRFLPSALCCPGHTFHKHWSEFQQCCQ